MNSNNNKIQTLINHLEQEINWVEDLNILLAEEKTILATRQFDMLEDFANRKQDLSNKLEGSAKQRLGLFNTTDSRDVTPLPASEFLKNCSMEDSIQINNLNSKLAEKLQYCRELNTVNGQVIANNIHTRQEIVNALSGSKTDAVNVYTSNGNMTTKKDNSHHQEA